MTYQEIQEHLDEPECLHVLKVIIKATLGIDLKKTELMNPQLIPDTFNEKSNTLDVLIKLDDEIYVNIETIEIIISIYLKENQWRN